MPVALLYCVKYNRVSVQRDRQMQTQNTELTRYCVEPAQ